MLEWHACGMQNLSSLQRLNVRHNQLRRIEALAMCKDLSQLTDLNMLGNPLEAAQHAHLYVVHLLSQVRRLYAPPAALGLFHPHDCRQLQAISMVKIVRNW